MLWGRRARRRQRRVEEEAGRGIDRGEIGPARGISVDPGPETGTGGDGRGLGPDRAPGPAVRITLIGTGTRIDGEVDPGLGIAAAVVAQERNRRHPGVDLVN